MVRRKRSVDRLPAFAFEFVPADWAGACLGVRYAAWRAKRDLLWDEVMVTPGRRGAVDMLRGKHTARRMVVTHQQSCEECAHIPCDR